MAAKPPSSKKTKPPGKKRAVASSGKGSAKKAAPRKKVAANKKPSVRKGKTTPPANRTIETISTVLTTVFFVLFALFVAYVLLHPKGDDKPPKDRPAAVKKSPKVKSSKFDKPEFEVYPVKPVPSARSAATPPAKTAEANAVKAPPSQGPEIPTEILPKLAIIIDDFGYDIEMAKRFIKIGGQLTCAVLPQSAYGRQIAILAKQAGHEVMLHQPMEPNEYPTVDPGPGAILASMTPDERINRLSANIDAIPGVVGVNNHMGSKLTTLSDEMNQVFTVLKSRNLFFVDSRTTAATVSQSAARLFKVPFAERDVFLDHVREEAAVRAQIEQLLNIAEIHGKAVGIGHPHEVTYRVLKESLPEMKKRVRLVPASAIIEVF